MKSLQALVEQLLNVALAVGRQRRHAVLDAEGVQGQDVVAVQPHGPAVDEVEEAAEHGATLGRLLQVQGRPGAGRLRLLGRLFTFISGVRVARGESGGVAVRDVVVHAGTQAAAGVAGAHRTTTRGCCCCGCCRSCGGGDKRCQPLTLEPHDHLVRVEHVHPLVNVQQEVAELLVVVQRLERLGGLDLLVAVAAPARPAGEAGRIALVVVGRTGRVRGGGQQPGRQGRRGSRGAVTLHLAGSRHGGLCACAALGMLVGLTSWRCCRRHGR